MASISGLPCLAAVAEHVARRASVHQCRGCVVLFCFGRVSTWLWAWRLDPCPLGLLQVSPAVEGEGVRTGDVVCAWREAGEKERESIECMDSVNRVWIYL